MPNVASAQFGAYRLKRQIGRTPSAVVYEASAPNRQAVAVKVIYKDASHDANARARFQRTAQLAMSLRHPGIVPVIDSGELNGQLFMVMPFIRGEDLQKRLAHQPRVPWPEARRIAAQAGEALAFAHRSNIVHGDVKPSNIMLRPNGHVMLMDFGIANVKGTRYSTSAFIMGTPAYMPPEQIDGQPMDGRGDQYALASVLYEMLAGHRPFTGDNIAVVLHKQIYEAPTPLPPERIPPAVAAVVMRALAKHPDERYPSMAAFLQALQQTDERKPPRPNNWLNIILVAMLMAALLVGLVVFVSMQVGR